MRRTPSTRRLLAILVIGSSLSASDELYAGEALEEAIRSCDYRAALDSLESSEFPEGADRELALGKVHLISGDTQSAIESLTRASDADSGSSEIRLWLSRALFAGAGEANPFRKPFLARRALRELRSARQLDPRNEDAILDLLLVHLRVPILGDGREAADELAAELRSRSSPTASLADAILAYEDERWEDAERLLTRAVNDLEDPRRALFWSIFLYQKIEDWDAAFATHEKLLRLSPNDPRVWYEFARTSDFSGLRTVAAIEYVDAYLSATLPSGAPGLSEARELRSRLQGRGQSRSMTTRDP